LSSVTAQAATGAANASPVSAATGSSSAAHPERITAKAAITTMKHAEFIATRIVMNITCPR
jgi:hypothetical protein